MQYYHVLHAIIYSIQQHHDWKMRGKKRESIHPKVEKVELFGALKYVSREYFSFILCMEYVFMNIFTP